MSFVFECNDEPSRHTVSMISSAGGADIYVGSPLFGAPVLQDGNVRPNKLLVLDLNILGNIRSGDNDENIKKLLAWAAINKAEVTPLVALSEQYRTHGNSLFAYEDYFRVLREKYGLHISSEEMHKNFKVMEQLSSGIKANTVLWRNYLLVMKKFYHSKSGFKKKVKDFFDFIQARDLPIFMNGLYLGCSYFHMKEFASKYEKALVSKIQSDMEYQGRSHQDRLMNVASDMALYQSAVELFYIREIDQYNVVFIASGDVTVPHALREVCWAGISVRPEGNFGQMGFRPGGLSGQDIFKVLEPCFRLIGNRVNDGASVAVRKTNLERVAEEIFQEFASR